MSDPALRGIYITAGVALFIGVLAQIVSVVNQVMTNRAASRRETQKHYNTVYQELFAPLIPDVFLYIDMVTNFRRRHDATEAQELTVKDMAIAFATEHLQYASPQLVASLYRIRHHALSDLRGMNPSVAELQFLLDVVHEYRDVIQRSSIFSKEKQAAQLAPIDRYLILYLLHNSGFNDVAMLSWRFHKDAFSFANYQRLEKVISAAKAERWNVPDKARKRLPKPEQLPESASKEEQQAAQDRAYRAEFDVQQAISREIKREVVVKIVAILIRDSEARTEVIEGTMTPSEQDFNQPFF